jgi:glycosyltransferase involved in cell wall biosynthesis
VRILESGNLRRRTFVSLAHGEVPLKSDEPPSRETIDSGSASVFERELIKVLFVIPSLGLGGGERVLLNLVRHFDQDRFEIGIVLLGRKGDLSAMVPNTVRIHELNRRGWWSFPSLILRLILLLRRERPDAVYSLMPTANLLCLCVRLLHGHQTTFVVSEHLARSLGSAADRFGRLKRIMSRLLYPLADEIVAVSCGVKADLVRTLRLKDCRVQVIYNPCDLKEIRRLAGVSGDVAEGIAATFGRIPTIVSCGRLVQHKDLGTLIIAFSEVLKTCEARLVIVGDGPERPALESLVASLDVDKVVTFVGMKANPYPYIAHATLFAMSSSYEGFGLVLVEAMTLGVPVVATDCIAGPSEVLAGGECGVLVDVGDHSGMAKAIISILSDKQLSTRLTNSGLARCTEFDTEGIVRLHENVIVRAIEKGRAA